jgi:hypothetical protein
LRTNVFCRTLNSKEDSLATATQNLHNCGGI